jgi:hypothetical protein
MIIFMSYIIYFLITLLVCRRFSQGIIEAEDGSVCFNNCSGHGTCKDYSCHCASGYDGDDCSNTFGSDKKPVIPILSVGDLNLTSKNFTQNVSRNKYLLVGFSSRTCHRCIGVENNYLELVENLKSLKVPFARADITKIGSLAQELNINQLPAIILFKKQRPIVYYGAHLASSITAFVKKQVSSPSILLKRKEDVDSYLESRSDSKYTLSTVMVIGFFSEHEDIEEDDYEDFTIAAEELQIYPDIYIAHVTSKAVSSWYKTQKVIDRTPSLYLMNVEGVVHTINLDEFYGEKMNIKDWILR